MILWNCLFELPGVIIGITHKPLWIETSRMAAGRSLKKENPVKHLEMWKGTGS